MGAETLTRSQTGTFSKTACFGLGFVKSVERPKSRIGRTDQHLEKTMAQEADLHALSDLRKEIEQYRQTIREFHMRMRRYGFPLIAEWLEQRHPWLKD